MDRFESNVPPEVTSSGERNFYLLSSKRGLGHVSRAVAIAENWKQEFLQNMGFGMYPRVEDFVINNIGPVNARVVEYSFSANNMPLEKDLDKARQQFFRENSEFLAEIKSENPKVIMVDFLAQSIFLREFIDAEGLNSLIVGVYHSADGFNPVERDEISDWQANIKKVASTMDVVFLSEPFGKHRSPYLLESGTLMMPFGQIVRKVTKNKEDIKKEIGLMDDDDYILIQAGMRGNGELSKLLSNLNESVLGNAKIVVMNYDDQFRESVKGNDRFVFLSGVPDGHNYVAWAKGVIGKPGMQTLSECVAYGVPLLFVEDSHPERMIKNEMLKRIIGQDMPSLLLMDGEEEDQLKTWINNEQNLRAKMLDNSDPSAVLVSETIERIVNEGDRADNNEDVVVRTTTPPGKKEGQLSYVESAKKIKLWRDKVSEDLINPLERSGFKFSIVGFGGVGKEVLRPDSDLDVILVVSENETTGVINQLNQIIDFSDAPRLESISELREGSLDSMRLKVILSDGTEMNISLMTDKSYKKIFSPFTKNFTEELRESRSGNPYFIPDFLGDDYAIPKVHDLISEDGMVKKVRLSPGIIEVQGKKLLGVKQRMLLTSNIWHDGLGLGNPTRKLMRGVARAICFWNNLYEIDGDRVIGVSRSAFRKEYFFRILRDPMSMYSPRKARELQNLFFNELRRIDFLARKRIMAE